ncbi:MAG TPA: hypothetical protein VHW43_04220 [Puia sp.]|nr:hypothetical protein [Puia sp.]
MSLAITKLSQTLINGSKKIALATALFLTVGISSSFATPTEGDNDVATASFHKDFKKAEVMQKEAGKNFTKFTFKLNDVVLFAFYNENGQLLAITRNIQSNQLPVQLLIDLKKNYANYWISDLFEYTGDDTSSYYITLENCDNRVILRSNGIYWEVYDKKAKQ